MILYSVDLIKFLRGFCLHNSYTRNRPLNYLLKDLIKHESLSVIMSDYPMSVIDIIASIDWLKEHLSACENKIPQRWAVDLTEAEEASKSPIIGRVRLFISRQLPSVDRIFDASVIKSNASSMFFHAGKFCALLHVRRTMN